MVSPLALAVPILESEQRCGRLLLLADSRGALLIWASAAGITRL